MEIEKNVLIDPSNEDLRQTLIGVWYVVSFEGLSCLHIRGHNYIAALSFCPDHANDGQWIAKLISYHRYITVSNRRFFSKDRAMQECEAWLNARNDLSDE